MAVSEIIAFVSTSVEVADLVNRLLPKLYGKHVDAKSVDLEDVQMNYNSYAKVLNYYAYFRFPSDNGRRKFIFWSKKNRKIIYYLNLRCNLGFLNIQSTNTFQSVKNRSFPLLELRPTIKSIYRNNAQNGDRIQVDIPVRIDLDSEIKFNWNKSDPTHEIIELYNPLQIDVDEYVISFPIDPNLEVLRRIVVKTNGQDVPLGFKLIWNSNKWIPSERAKEINISSDAWRDGNDTQKDHKIWFTVDLKSNSSMEIHVYYGERNESEVKG